MDYVRDYLWSDVKGELQSAVLKKPYKIILKQNCDCPKSPKPYMVLYIEHYRPFSQFQLLYINHEGLENGLGTPICLHIDEIAALRCPKCWRSTSVMSIFE